MNAYQIRQEVLAWMRYLPTPDYVVVNQDRWRVTGLMNDALRLGASSKEANRRRKEVLAWLFRDYLNQPNISSLSSKELPAECWWALWMYCEPYFDRDTNEWKAKDGFNDAMCTCLAEIARWYAAMNAQCGLEEEDVQDH